MSTALNSSRGKSCNIPTLDMEVEFTHTHLTQNEPPEQINKQKRYGIDESQHCLQYLCVVALIFPEAKFNTLNLNFYIIARDK